jgi:hypothetical protein
METHENLDPKLIDSPLRIIHLVVVGNDGVGEFDIAL